MIIVLLPGLDGTGLLFKPFVQLLPPELDVRILHYPRDRYLTYEQLAEEVAGQIPERNRTRLLRSPILGQSPVY